MYRPPKLQAQAIDQAEEWIGGRDGRMIRRARAGDLDAVRELKTEVIAGSFSEFLRTDEVRGEIDDVCSREAVQRMIRENLVLIAERGEEAVAIGALKADGAIFSCYSKGARAGTAIVLELIDQALRKGSPVRCWIYSGNLLSKDLFSDFGFRDTGRRHRSSAAPRVPVEHWELPDHSLVDQKSAWHHGQSLTSDSDG